MLSISQCPSSPCIFPFFHNQQPNEYTICIDILVSELLGSFGDNELSPECLDGAQKFLKPTGVSIPTSYTSYIGPIQVRFHFWLNKKLKWKNVRVFICSKSGGSWWVRISARQRVISKDVKKWFLVLLRCRILKDRVRGNVWPKTGENDHQAQLGLPVKGGAI